MSKTIQIPNHIPISWLTQQKTLDDETLFLVSVPNQNTETGYISRFIKFKDLKTEFRGAVNSTQSSFKIARTPVELQSSNSQEPAFDAMLCCESTTNPYVISSLFQKDGIITKLDGYRLSSAMDEIFKSVEFETMNCKEFKQQHKIVETDVDAEKYLVIQNNSTNYATISSDFSLKSESSIDSFRLFATIEKKCTMNLKHLDFENIMQDNSKSDVCQLEKGKKYLFCFQKIDPKTLYVSRQILKNIEVSE